MRGVNLTRSRMGYEDGWTRLLSVMQRSRAFIHDQEKLTQIWEDVKICVLGRSLSSPSVLLLLSLPLSWVFLALPLPTPPPLSLGSIFLCHIPLPVLKLGRCPQNRRKLFTEIFRGT
jgi:hypothetical protein